MEVKAIPRSEVVQVAGTSNHPRRNADLSEGDLPSSAISRINVRAEVQNLSIQGGLSHAEGFHMRESLDGGDLTAGFGRTAITQKAPIQVAKEIVESYEYKIPGPLKFINKDAGVSTFTIPAGVTDVEAMKALNMYCRERLPHLNRDAICQDDLAWFEKLPETHPRHCQARDYTHERKITIIGLVKGTKGKASWQADDILKQQSLTRADPRDQAIAAAIHSCKHEGEDLFRGLRIHHSLHASPLETSNLGITRVFFFTGYDRQAVSGTPLLKGK